MSNPIFDAMATHTSSARLLQIKSQLQCSSKGNNSISDYCDQIKNLANQLAIARDPLTHSNFILYLLHGLGSEYDFVVTSVTSRIDLISFDELHDGINRNNAQPDFIPSCENLIGNNLIE